MRIYSHIFCIRKIIRREKSLYILLLLIAFFFFPFFLSQAHAGPQGTTYEIKNYGFGSGGTNGLTGTTYGVSGLSGEQAGKSTQGTTYRLGPGLLVTQLSAVAAAPIFTNPGTNYDRLQFVIVPGNNPSGTTYALEISTDNFTTDLRYVKNDGTVGNTLTATDFKTYSNWGGAAGTWITGLTNNTTYYLRVKTRQGQYTDSAWGPSASMATSNASLTFTLSASSITFNTLTPGNSFTDATKSTTVTTSTNAYNGYIIYGKDNQPLTSPNSTIANYSSPNNIPTVWSGTGFGYTTNDTNLSGSGGINRFTTGTKYAGFQTTGQGDPVADNAGPVTTTPISNEQFTVSYRVTASNTTPAGTYGNIVMYTIVPQY